jgi:UDP-GlcNAc3NAcA epimerase
VKILSVVGARPQFIKAGPVSRALRSAPGVEEVLVHTGQHYDENMSAIFFEELALPRPDLELGVGSASHAVQTGRMLEALEPVLRRERPDWALVYGDTNSTLAGALAAAKLGLPVAHVEAGLRSGNRRMPEEINRILADRCSDLLFAPTRAAVANLRREGVPEERIAAVGDVMYDAVLFHAERAEARSRALAELGLAPGGYVLATVHRAENTDDPSRLRAILDGLSAVAEELPVVLPLHPRTRARLGAEATAPAAKLRLLAPVGYLDMLMLEKHAALVATDSGGVQKEAYFQRVPCVTLRGETEWVELVELGWNRLAPPVSPGAVRDAVRAALRAPRPAAGGASPYGDGRAAEAICRRLLAQSEGVRR